MLYLMGGLASFECMDFGMGWVGQERGSMSIFWVVLVVGTQKLVLEDCFVLSDLVAWGLLSPDFRIMRRGGEKLVWIFYIHGLYDSFPCKSF